MPNRIIPYNPGLKKLARQLRKQGILSEVLLWRQVQRRNLGVEFHRQVPIDEFIVDFYCHELMLAIEVDGYSHQFFDDIKVKDEARQKRLESLGVKFLRFQDSEVRKDVSLVVNVILERIKELQTSP